MQPCLLHFDGNPLVPTLASRMPHPISPSSNSTNPHLRNGKSPSAAGVRRMSSATIQSPSITPAPTTSDGPSTMNHPRSTATTSRAPRTFEFSTGTWAPRNLVHPVPLCSTRTSGSSASFTAVSPPAATILKTGMAASRSRGTTACSPIWTRTTRAIASATRFREQDSR